MAFVQLQASIEQNHISKYIVIEKRNLMTLIKKLPVKKVKLKRSKMKQTRNLTPKKKKKWILKNCINGNGDIDLRNLDFSDVNADVNLSNMKVNRSIFQVDQEAGGDIIQDVQEAGGDIFQSYQLAGGRIYQKYQKEKKNI